MLNYVTGKTRQGYTPAAKVHLGGVEFQQFAVRQVKMGEVVVKVKMKERAVKVEMKM